MKRSRKNPALAVVVADAVAAVVAAVVVVADSVAAVAAVVAVVVATVIVVGKINANKLAYITADSYGSNK